MIIFQKQLFITTIFCTHIHKRSFNKVASMDYSSRPEISHVVVLLDVASSLESMVWDFLKQHSIQWWLPVNHFNGGNAMPKIYCAFSKDLENVGYYAPHMSHARPLLAYKAQPISSFPLLPTFSSILNRFDFTTWNFVTVVLYAGKGSGISLHRDRIQIEGYEEADEDIAAFVFGTSR